MQCTLWTVTNNISSRSSYRPKLAKVCSHIYIYADVQTNPSNGIRRGETTLGLSSTFWKWLSGYRETKEKVVRRSFADQLAMGRIFKHIPFFRAMLRRYYLSLIGLDVVRVCWRLMSGFRNTLLFILSHAYVVTVVGLRTTIRPTTERFPTYIEQIAIDSHRTSNHDI